MKNSPANAGDTGLIPRSERSPGEGNENSLQYSCLGNSMDRGAGVGGGGHSPWGHTELDTTERLSTYTHSTAVHILQKSVFLPISPSRM